MYSPEEEREREEFKAFVPMSEFMEAARVKFLSFTEDANGGLWAFVEFPRQFVHSPWSARPTVHGDTLELAIRQRWTDEYPEMPAGDYRFVEELWGVKDPFLKPMFDQGPKFTPETWIGAIALPFRPTTITFVDR